MPDIERYLNVRSAGSASVGPDGDRISFLMDVTGTSQVWTIDEPGAWPEQVTFEDDSVSFASFSPERDELVFGMDEGGNERVQFFRLAGDGSTVDPLTDAPEAKHRWGGWDSAGDRFAFASNRRDASAFDVYVQGREERGDDADLIHEGDGWLSLAGWSPSDDRLLVHEAYSNYDMDAYTLDLDSGALRHVTPHEGDVRYASVEWGPEGDALYLVTDDGADSLYLARLDLDTLDLDAVVDGGEYNVDGVAIDEDSGRLAYSRNVEGYTELTVGAFADPTTIRAFPEPDLPEGAAGGVDFGPDAERFAVTATGRRDNANVYVVDVETGEATTWTDASTAGIPRETFVEPDLVHVESFDGLEIPGFLTLPEEDTIPEAGAPVIVDIHGGPESQRRPSFSALTQHFVASGYAVFEPNVRGSTGYGKEYTRLDDVRNRMDAVADLAACAEWLADHAAVDPDRIVAYGGSYGGFMVLAALTEYPDLWAAGVDVVGIANFVTFLENTGEWRRSLREAEYGSLTEDREFLKSISPINSVDAIEAPLFVLHGANDPRVPVEEAEQIADAVGERGIPVEKMIFEDEGHGLSKLENRIEAYTAIVGFLNRHV
jgi:dipeptidyl aminopeptidase/acylaminoacyl peptidase